MPTDQPGTAAWHEERVEASLPDGTVFVFRWVPDFAPIGGRRKEHPTFAEWLADMSAAAEGLDGPSPACRTTYDMQEFGVDGHRPMTAPERAEFETRLEQEIAGRHALLDELRGGSDAT